MDTPSRKDDIFASLGAAVLLIGTATGSSKALLILSGASLVLMLVFGLNRKRVTRGALLPAIVAAIVAFVVGLVLTLR